MPNQDYQKAFEFHGIPLEDKGGQLQGMCPFCDKENHFFVNPETGQWDCKAGDCGKRGNFYTFLADAYDLGKKSTTPDSYKVLKQERGISYRFLQKSGLVMSPYTGQWLFPINNAKGSLSDLKTWSSRNGKMYVTPTCSTHLYSFKEMDSEGPVYLCEGEWDALALGWMLKRVKEEHYSILAVPGANTFKDDWKHLFDGRDVVLLFDNDKAGQEGMDRVIKILKSCDRLPTSIKCLKWYDSLPQGYDIRDFATEMGNVKDPKTALADLYTLLIPYEEAEFKPDERIECSTFQEVLSSFRSVLHINQDFADALAVSFATVVSGRIGGDPIWMFLVGPPGCGKSTIIQCFGISNEYIESLSKMTAASLVSGWKSDDGSDAGFLPNLNKKCLTNKDYTAVSRMGNAAVEELHGLLRDIYDGEFRTHYGNKEARTYQNLRFSMLAGVTDIIHADDRASLGERFLKVDMVGGELDCKQRVRAAMNQSLDKDDHLPTFRKYVLGYLDHCTKVMDVKDLPNLSDQFKDRVVALSQIIAYLRARVSRDRTGGILYRMRPEVGTRLASQMVRLGRVLAVILGEDEVTDECYRLLQKVAFDTAVGFNLEIVSLLSKHANGLSVDQVAYTLQLSDTSIRNRVDDLQELGAIECVQYPNGKPGRDVHIFRLSDDMRRLWKDAGINQEVVANAPSPKKVPKQVIRKKRKRKKSTT